MEITLKNESVIWITGLSSSGKTTLALEVQRLLKTKGVPAILLDGDDLREVILGTTKDQNQQFDEAKRKNWHLSIAVWQSSFGTRLVGDSFNYFNEKISF